MKYTCNSGLVILYRDGELTIRSSNPSLKRRIVSKNNDKLYNLLNFLKTPRDKTSIMLFLNETEEKTNKIIDKLLDLGIILKDALTTEDKFFRLDRFINALPQKNYSEYTKKADNIKILILGIGTAGSYSIELLSKIGFNDFFIIDNDVVEKKNIISQNYDDNDIGMYKVNSIKKKYPECNIKTLNDKIPNYKALQPYLLSYKPDYLLSNADDSDLVIDILNNLFNDLPDIKVIETGYNITTTQSEYINKDNVDYFTDKFKHINASFRNSNGDFVGISDNSGIIFHAITCAFFSAKFIFDDVLEIADSNFGNFDFLKNKYFLDNMYYLPEFEDYVKRYNEDNTYLPVKSKKEPSKKSGLNSNIKLFLAKKIDFSNFNFLRNLNLSSIAKMHITQKEIKMLIERYIATLYDCDSVLDRTLVYIPGNSYSNIRSYAEKVEKAGISTRIYLNGEREYIIPEYIHEMMHSIFFHISNDEYKHEKFVLGETLSFLVYLHETKSKYFCYLTYKTLKYIQGYYLDYFTVVSYEKYNLLNSKTRFYEEFPFSESKIDSSDFENKYICMTNNKENFYYLKYVVAVDDNIDKLKLLISKYRGNL